MYTTTGWIDKKIYSHSWSPEDKSLLIRLKFSLTVWNISKAFWGSCFPQNQLLRTLMIPQQCLVVSVQSQSKHQCECVCDVIISQSANRKCELALSCRKKEVWATHFNTLKYCLSVSWPKETCSMSVGMSAWLTGVSVHHISPQLQNNLNISTSTKTKLQARKHPDSRCIALISLCHSDTDLRFYLKRLSVSPVPGSQRRWVCSWSWRKPFVCRRPASLWASIPALLHWACADILRGSRPSRAAWRLAATWASTRWWTGSPPDPLPSPSSTADAPGDTCCGSDPRQSRCYYTPAPVEEPIAGYQQVEQRRVCP